MARRTTRRIIGSPSISRVSLLRPIRDEVPVAFVVAADADQPPELAELHSWCESHLSKAKRPREITLMPELPRTSVGKIRKFLLKEEVRTS